MMAVPRRSQRAAEQEADTQANVEVEPGTTDEAAADDTEVLPVLATNAPLALPAGGPELKADPGLYAVLGLDPSVSDVEIQTTYRRQAARLLGSGSNDVQALKQLNVAYEVLGNPIRRAEYDRLRLMQLTSPAAPPQVRPGVKAFTVVTRRRRPRQVVQPRYAGLGDVLV